MNVSLYQAAAAMNASARWQEMVADNLAASSLPGYKKQDISFEAVPATPALSGAGPVMPRAVVSTNFRPGEIKVTGVKTDLAVEGSGFLEVQLPNGAHGYTRDGELHINSSGQLVTKQGHPVLGEAGPLQLDPNDAGALTITSGGDVTQGGVSRGRLRVVEFADPRMLRSISGGYFLADSATSPQDAKSSMVRQGCLETANLNTVAEMAGLISSMRQFEANQRVLHLQNDRLERTITTLGSSS